MDKILPIGTIVRLKKGEQKIMIICRFPLYNNEGTIGYFDYSACIYPMGQTNQEVFFFNEEDIEEVCFEGFKDQEEERLCEIYKESVQNIGYPRLQLQFEEEPI